MEKEIKLLTKDKSSSNKTTDLNKNDPDVLIKVFLVTLITNINTLNA